MSPLDGPSGRRSSPLSDRSPSSAGAGAAPEVLRDAPLGRARAAESTASLRHAHAVEMAHHGVPLIVIRRHVGHTDLGITSIYSRT